MATDVTGPAERAQNSGVREAIERELARRARRRAVADRAQRVAEQLFFLTLTVFALAFFAKLVGLVDAVF